METEAPGEVLVRAERRVFLGAVLAVFLSCLLSSWPLYLLLLWCCAAGLLSAYFLFRMLPRTPNLLLHMKHPSRQPQDPAPSCPLSPLALACPVCFKPDCQRHDRKKKKDYLKPWDDLNIPQSVDSALSEILEIIMQRFVYSWHRHLVPASESIEDEMRVAIRHAAAVLLHRAHKVDLPLLVTSKFLQPIAAHIHTYVKARERLPADAAVTAIEEAVLKEYGDHIHSAMRGTTGNIRYFRRLARSLLPLLLPGDMLESRMMCSLVEEIFASKVFVPAMNFTAKPDFINKLILIAFDKNSRLERVFGPASKDVSFLSKWALARSRYWQQRCPLDIPLPELLDPEYQLYVFMQFMKARDDIYILQVYLSLNELKQKVSGVSGIVDTKAAPEILTQVEELYQRFFCPSSQSYLQLDLTEVAKISAVLSSESSTAVEKCEELKRTNVFGRLKGYIYHELLMKVYYPRFLQSYQFYEKYLGKETNKAEGTAEGTKTKGDRWRQKTKQLKKLSQPSMDPSPPEEQDPSADVGTEEMSKLLQVPKYVQIVDAEVHMEGIRPYTVYIIMTKKEGADTKYILVRRRYKEFVGLDVKLRQFHGDIQVQLPSKKAFRNMEKAFVEIRCRELEQYLGTLITYYGVQDSQILASFLSPDSDPALFLPESVTGKVKKAVSIKRDKGQHYDELLQTLLLVVEPPNHQPSPETVAEVTAQSDTNKENRQHYLEAATEDLSNSESNRYKPWLHPSSSSSSKDSPMDDIQMDCLMDLLVLVSVAVYHVSPIQLTMLMLTKLLAQETMEALAYKFVAGKVELMVTEAHVIRLVHILRDNLFFSKDPPRREEDIRQRLQQTVDRLLHYPNPLLVKVIGEDRFMTGTATIVEGLQCRELNKQLFFKLLDIILLELFPELGEEGLG